MLETELANSGKKHYLWKSADRQDPNVDALHPDLVPGLDAIVAWMDNWVGAPAKKKAEKEGTSGGKAGKGGKAKATRSKTAAAKAGEAIEPPPEKPYSSKYWPLIPFSSYDWRLSDNRKRDFKKWGRMALVAKKEIEDYRASMFKLSPAAKYLRQEFQTLMSGLCVEKTVKFTDREDIETNSTWVYFDMIETKSSNYAPPDTDIAVLHATRMREVAIYKKKKAFEMQMLRLEQLPIMTATPLTSGVHPNIHRSIRHLLNVRLLSTYALQVLISVSYRMSWRISRDTN